MCVFVFLDGELISRITVGSQEDVILCFLALICSAVENANLVVFSTACELLICLHVHVGSSMSWCKGEA